MTNPGGCALAFGSEHAREIAQVGLLLDARRSLDDASNGRRADARFGLLAQLALDVRPGHGRAWIAARIAHFPIERSAARLDLHGGGASALLEERGELRLGFE